MIQILNAIPDPDMLLALEPEELGAKMLFLIRGRSDAAMFNIGTLRTELWNSHLPSQYPYGRKSEIDLALAEALAWLEAQGLIVPAEGMNGNNGWRHLSRPARKFEDETALKNFTVARHLPKDSLHPRIATPVWQAFMRGQFDVAVFLAPSLFVRLSSAIIIKVGWEAQIPAETGGRNDLVNYERNQVRAQFAWNF
jgi:hypothetical protein